LAMNKLSKSKRNRLMQVLLGTVVLGVAIWMQLIKPEQTALREKKNLMQAADQARETTGRQHTAFLEKSQAEVTAAQEKLERLEKAMAYGDVYRWAIRTFSATTGDWEIENVQIDPPKPGEAPILPKVPYSSRVFSITGSAYYHDFGKYLADLENSLPHIRLQKLELEPLHVGDSNSDEGEMLNFKMEINTLTRSAQNNL
jgi:hypothetical protein